MQKTCVLPSVLGINGVLENSLGTSLLLMGISGPGDSSQYTAPNPEAILFFGFVKSLGKLFTLSSHVSRAGQVTQLGNGGGGLAFPGWLEDCAKGPFTHGQMHLRDELCHSFVWFVWGGGLLLFGLVWLF